MKIKYTIMLLAGCLFPICSQSQDMQATFMSELRAGYSSNTYLNPYFSEWDRSFQSGFGLASGFGQLFWDKNKHKFELNGGYVFEPFLDDQPSWQGYLAFFRYTAQLHPKLNAGINAGTSGFESDFERDLHWIQPYLTWFPSAFTSVSFKAGSNFRKYIAFQDSINTDDRIDSYALEIEWWPAVRWQFKGGIYGSFDNLPSIQNGLSANFSVAHLFKNGSRISSGVQFVNYSSETVTTVEDGGGPGGPFGPPGGTNQTQTMSISDQIWRLRFEGSYPLSKSNNIFAFVAAERSVYNSSSLDDKIGDVQVSGGIRFTLNRTLNTPGTYLVEPKWKQKSDHIVVEMKYNGNGNVYLVGDFNNWDKPGISLTEISRNTYKTILKLEPGIYEYRVLVLNVSDQEWIEFSNNVYTVHDSFGGTNAILTVE